MHGTAAGDMLLKAIAKRLLATFREDDVVSRFDGDKFMTLFSDIASTDDIIDVVRKTFNSFENPFLIADEEMYITASLGVCVYPNDGENAEQLINNSESAMYASKERGRGTYQLFDAELNDGLLSRIKMETDLKTAIMEKELETYFQPKVSHDGTILGMESLIRWHSHTRGPVSPSQFIGIAEKNGMIVDIGNLVLRESCRLTKKWLDQGFPPMRVSVNISPYQFREDYINTIQDILKETGLDPGLLEIEITESGIMENEEENIRKLHQLHNLGVSISIDDFGTGYSSLSKLKEYPIDTLKIDKSFIDELPHNDKSLRWPGQS
jgi:predicted signal transduction protein with EAL and GGDEF domain